MKKHFVIFVIVFLVTIGFAAANTVLDITGSLNVAENIEDFKIEITNLKINNNEKKEFISKDKESFTFTGSGNDTLEYTVTNYSYQYDANIVLICVPSENVNVEQINNLPAQERSTKSITSTSKNAITCTIRVEKISRTDYAEDMCKYVEGTVWTFNYTGAEQEFTVPCDGEYKIELWGAQGNSPVSLRAVGGNGAYTSGNIKLNVEERLFFYVGQHKNAAISSSYNSGSTGGSRYEGGITEPSGQGGGGATDVRLTSGEWSNFNSLKSRIMIAAGGGGANNYIYSSVGGAGGGISGYSGINNHYPNYPTNTVPTGGTQTSGGIATDNGNGGAGHIAFGGTFGIGGSGGTNWGSGGAGGYYGGGGGGATGGSVDSGAGGSSFISGHNGCDAITESSTETNIIHTGQPNHYSGLVFTDTVMVDGAGYKWTNVKGMHTGMPTHDGTGTMTGNSGNGYAKLTYLGK